MADKQKMLELKVKMKKRKPVFTRRNWNKNKRIEDDVWRHPRGVDNKQRLKKKGHRKGPSTGYRSPVLVRGLHHSGLMPVLVATQSQVENLTKEQGIIIASNTGARKKKLIIELAMKKGIKILNLNPEEKIKQIDAELKERQANKKKHAEEKQQKQKKGIDEKLKEEAKKEKDKEKDKEKEQIAAAAPESASAGEAQLSEEELKKKLEKEEKDKVLTKRG